MQIGIVGLGRMGANMARRLARGGVRVVCYDQQPAAQQALSREKNLDCAENLAALCARLSGERVIILSLPAGDTVEDAIRELLPLCSAGDTIVDCGNSYYRDSKRRALALSQQGLRYIDAGVSGGIHGLEGGYCLMLGGTPKSIEIFEPFARKLAPEPERGWLHCGPSGAGHYAKMIHNGIEYGMMQSLAEGFALLAPSSTSTSGASPTPGAMAAWCAPGCSSCAPRSSRKTKPSPRSRRWWPIPAKGAGPWPKRSSSACRRPRSPRR
jgi:6-phosphogluconate dehydrogenase